MNILKFQASTEIQQEIRHINEGYTLESIMLGLRSGAMTTSIVDNHIYDWDNDKVAALVSTLDSNGEYENFEVLTNE